MALFLFVLNKAGNILLLMLILMYRKILTKELAIMFSFYVYHGRNRGVIFADSLDHAKEKFESKNAERGLALRVWKAKNAHSLETKVFKK